MLAIDASSAAFPGEVALTFVDEVVAVLEELSYVFAMSYLPYVINAFGTASKRKDGLH